MSCDDDWGDVDLLLGPDLGELTVVTVLGEAWNAALVLETDTDPATTQAWPAAPVLEFATGLEITATLGRDQDADVADSMATWSLSSDQVATLPSRIKVRLTVNGNAWFMGRVQCRS